jgi:hypothetical protein
MPLTEADIPRLRTGDRLRCVNNSGQRAIDDNLQLNEVYIFDRVNSMSDTTIGLQRQEGLGQQWYHEISLFELVDTDSDSIPELTNRPIQRGDRLEVISNGIHSHETQDYITMDGLHIGDIVTVSTVSSYSSFTIVGNYRYIHQLSHFRLIDSPDSNNTTFQVGDKVYVRTLDDIPEHESENWTTEDKDGLELNTEYIISKLGRSDNYEISGDTPCAWIKIENKRNYWHHPSRFMHKSEYKRNKLPKGTKSMPQVISTCDIGDIERSIFQACADKIKMDIYVYNMGGKYYDHPDNKLEGYHIYFNCLRASRYGKVSGHTANITKPGDSYYRDTIRSKASSSVKTTISILDGELYHSSSNSLYIGCDALSPMESSVENYNRINFLLWIAYNYFSVVNITFTGSDLSGLITAKLSERATSVEKQRQVEIQNKQLRIRSYETELISEHKQLVNLLNTVYSFDDEEGLVVINNIKKLPDISDISIELVNNLYIFVIKTHPLVVHLPHGDIPTGSITIKIEWGDTPRLIIDGEYRNTYFNPYYSDHICWGGFSSMVQKLLANCNFDVLVDIILQWYRNYDGSGMFRIWKHILDLKECGIIIDEGFYMSGELENE